MLDFEQKLAIFSSFPELVRKDVSLGRVNFHYEGSVHEKKNVGYHLHPNGNGFVYAALIPGAAADAKGFVNIRDASAEELRHWIAASIQSLSASTGSTAEAASPSTHKPDEAAESPSAEESHWHNADGQTLRLTFEDELWYIFAGPNLEAAFETHEEALEYMREEGFTAGKP